MENRYDPMTGELIKTDDDNVKGEIVGYDPMTGEPIFAGSQSNEEEEIVGYDPMTGEPIKKSMATNSFGFDPMTGKPIEQGNHVTSKGKKSSRGLMGVGAALVAVAAVIFVVFSVIKSGVFLGAPDKVLLAMYNTVNDKDLICEALTPLELLQKDSCTVSLNAAIKQNELNIEYANTKKQKMVTGEVRLEDIPSVEFTGIMTQNKILVQIPTIDSKIYSYSFDEVNRNSYLWEVAEDEGIDLEAVNGMLASVASKSSQKKTINGTVKNLLKEYRKLDFQKVATETYEVNGKMCKCKGYRTVITSENCLDMFDAVLAAQSSEVESTARRAMSELRDELRGMPDVDVTCYIYKNKLACVEVYCGGERVSVEFKGGKCRWQNLDVRYNRERVIELIGEQDSTSEELILKVQGIKLGEIYYDKKSGNFNAQAGTSLFNLGASVDANLKSSANKLEVDIREVEIGSMSFTMDGNCTIKKGAKIKKLSGSEWDLSEMTESQWEDLVDDWEALGDL